MPKRILPSIPTLLRWRDEEGLTHAQIAERISERNRMPVTRAAVSVALSRAGEQVSVSHKDVAPWRVRWEHRSKWPIEMLRLVSREQKGLPMSDTEAASLKNWKEKVAAADVVVAYNRDQGFFYVPRKESDWQWVRPQEIEANFPMKVRSLTGRSR